MSAQPAALDRSSYRGPVRAAVVGAGVMGRWHARELGRAGGLLVAVADRNRAAADRLAAACDGPPAYEDLDRLLRETTPDVVHVCTPISTHVGLARQVLDAGVNVLVEKPIAPTAAETVELVALAERAGVQLCPVHQYLFQKPMRELRRLLDAVSPLVHVGTFACSAGGTGREPGELDEIAAEILPHPLAVLERMLVTPVDELDWTARAPRAGELRAATLESSPTVSICVSMAGRPTANELIAVGERGTLRIDFFHGFAVIEPGAVSRQRKIARPLVLGASLALGAGANLVRRAADREPAYPGLRSLIAELYKSIRGLRDPPIAHAESIAVARARDALVATAFGAKPPVSEGSSERRARSGRVRPLLS